MGQEAERKRMGELLKSWRKQANLSQEFVAVIIGETMITYQRMERGEAPIETHVIRRIAELSGADPRRIYDEDPGLVDTRAIDPFVLIVNRAAPPHDPELSARLQAVVEQFNAEHKRAVAARTPVATPRTRPAPPKSRSSRPGRQPG